MSTCVQTKYTQCQLSPSIENCGFLSGFHEEQPPVSSEHISVPLYPRLIQGVFGVYTRLSSRNSHYRLRLVAVYLALEDVVFPSTSWTFRLDHIAIFAITFIKSLLETPVVVVLPWTSGSVSFRIRILGAACILFLMSGTQSYRLNRYLFKCDRDKNTRHCVEFRK